jgi:hypothetical protein
VNTYKEKEKELQGSIFSTESSRINDNKRKADDITPDVPRSVLYK